MSVAYASYEVEAEGELARRRLASAADRYRRAADEADHLSAAIAAARESLGLTGVVEPRVVLLSRRADAAEHEAAAHATEQAIVAARADFEAAMARARARAMTASVVAVTVEGLADDAATERAERLAARAALADTAAATERQAEVERLMARLPAEVDPESLRRVETAAQVAYEAPDGIAFARARDRLRGAVQVAADHDRARSDAAAQIDRWRTELDGLDGDDVERARARLDALDPARPLPLSVASEVRAAASAARATLDRSFALDALAATLDELGYAVDDGFATAVAQGGAVVPLPRSNQHGVQVRESDGHLLFNVVRYADGDDQGDVVADLKAETHWCSGYDRLVALAHEKGVALHLARPQPPGLQPLQHRERPAGDDRDSDVGRPYDAIRERGL